MADAVVDAKFPLNGVDRSDAYADQAPGTTPTGRNARAFDPLLSRGRGGSRAGLTKYLALPVDGVVGHEVQMLAAVVDPTTDALLANLEDWSGTGVPDPSTNNASGTADPDDPRTRNPGRYVRAGGSGVQPARRSTSAAPAAVGHRQSKGAQFGDFPFGTLGGARSDALAFDRPVLRKSLLVAVVHTINLAADAPPGPAQAVSDSLGLQWHEAPGSWAGGIPSVAGHYNGALRVFWAVAAIRPGSGACTVTVDSTAARDPLASPTAPDVPPVTLAVLEYTGLEYAPGLASTLDDDQSDETGNASGTGVITFSPGGSITPTRAGGVTLGVFGLGAGITAAAPLTAKPVNAGVLDPTVTYAVRLNVSSCLVVTEAVGEPAVTAVTPTLDADMTGHGALLNFTSVSLAASFRKGL